MKGTKANITKLFREDKATQHFQQQTIISTGMKFFNNSSQVSDKLFNADKKTLQRPTTELKSWHTRMSSQFDQHSIINMPAKSVSELKIVDNADNNDSAVMSDIAQIVKKNESCKRKTIRIRNSAKPASLSKNKDLMYRDQSMSYIDHLQGGKDTTLQDKIGEYEVVRSGQKSHSKDFSNSQSENLEKDSSQLDRSSFFRNHRMPYERF